MILYSYFICIRQEVGYCCNNYIPCPEFDNSFNINGDFKVMSQGEADAQCTTSYILIPGEGNYTINLSTDLSKFLIIYMATCFPKKLLWKTVCLKKS